MPWNKPQELGEMCRNYLKNKHQNYQSLQKWTPNTCGNNLKIIRKLSLLNCVKYGEITFKKYIKIILKTLPKRPPKTCVNKLKIYYEKSCINLVRFLEITFKKNNKIILKSLPKWPPKTCENKLIFYRELTARIGWNM